MALKSFTVFWLDGTTSVLEGKSQADALTRAGFGPGALGAIDFIGEGDGRNDWSWDGTKRKWIRA